MPTLKEILKTNVLPIKVKLTEYIHDEFLDVGSIFLIEKVTPTNENCIYVITIKILKEDIAYNTHIGNNDWFNDKHEPILTYFQVNHKNQDQNGDFVDTCYIDENDDCFEIIDENSLIDGFINRLEELYLEDYSKTKPGEIYPHPFHPDQINRIKKAFTEFLTNGKN